MPRKKRDIRRDYRAAGFRERQGTGDHVVYAHPLVPKHYAVDGKDGADNAIAVMVHREWVAAGWHLPT